MKRSEMLDKLQDILINLGYEKQLECACCHSEPTLEDAEVILHHLEYMGMLPPSFNPDTRNEVYFERNEWEPEND